MRTSSTFLLVLAAAAAAGFLGWKLGHHQPGSGSPTIPGERKILYYQSSMHPWIKSDKPGKCTICGMDLTPVYEGDKGFGATPGMVVLSSNSLNVLHLESGVVRTQSLSRTLRVAGTIEEDDTRRRVLSAYVDGRIDALHINAIGVEVQAGQPLAGLYSPMLLNAEREYALLMRQNAGGITNNASAPDASNSLLAGARQRLIRFGLTPAQIDQLPSKEESEAQSQIVAPITGTVLARFVYPGQYVKEGDKLFELADLSRVWFRFDVYEQDLSWIAPGQIVRLQAQSAPGQTVEGKVLFIEPTLQDSTRSAKVRVELDNPLLTQGQGARRLWLSRTYAQATVEVTSPDVLAVPRTAVLNTGKRVMVYLVREGGAFEQRQIKLGRRGDQHWEVLEGLTEGDRVVTTANLLLDAQSQINDSVQAGGEESPGNHETSAKSDHAHTHAWTPAQQAVASVVLLEMEQLAQSLASDDLEKSLQARKRVTNASAELLKVLPEGMSPAPFQIAAAWSGEQDLVGIRRAFHPFSLASADLLRTLRPLEPKLSNWKIFRCPMVSQAWEGAPKEGVWIQSKPPVRNPFFGAEMLDCGVEIP